MSNLGLRITDAKMNIIPSQHLGAPRPLWDTDENTYSKIPELIQSFSYFSMPLNPLEGLIKQTAGPYPQSSDFMLLRG